MTEKNKLFVPLMIVTIYAGLITVPSYVQIKQSIISWAVKQPEADVYLTGYTPEQREELNEAIRKSSLPVKGGLK